MPDGVKGIKVEDLVASLYYVVKAAVDGTMPFFQQERAAECADLVAKKVTRGFSFAVAPASSLCLPLPQLLHCRSYSA
jgi:hypothetical protein